MRSVILCGWALVLLIACGGSARRVAALEARVRTLEEAVAALEARATQEAQLRQQFADVQLALATIDETRQRVEAMTSDFAQRQRDVAILLDDLTARVLRLESAASPETSGVRIDATVRDVFDRARMDLDAGRWELATMGFRSFLEQYPDNPLAADAQFFLGESFYVRDRFEEACPEYQKVVDRYPQSPRRALAMLRMASCLERMGKRDEAVTWFRRIVETYPGTNEALAARERLADIP